LFLLRKLMMRYARARVMAPGPAARHPLAEPVADVPFWIAVIWLLADAGADHWSAEVVLAALLALVGARKAKRFA
jgi:hypothetical protein